MSSEDFTINIQLAIGEKKPANGDGRDHRNDS